MKNNCKITCKHCIIMIVKYNNRSKALQSQGKYIYIKQKTPKGATSIDRFYTNAFIIYSKFKQP